MMNLRSTVYQEIRDLIATQRQITFAQFMQVCLYSPHGGFYASRDSKISSHFGTSPTSHPVFGALIARQLEQMWHLLGAPPVFHLIEVGCGDGALAQSIVEACWHTAPRFAQALYYVAADYQPCWLQTRDHSFDWSSETGEGISPNRQDAISGIQRVKADGLRAFRHLVGCILCNELIDNFPVHRFVIEGGSVKEVFVTLEGGNLTEVLDKPSSPRIEQRLTSLGLSLAEGYRGEVNLAIEDWTGQLSSALDRGFILTIDYGQLAAELYVPQNRQGTLVCHHRHVVSSDPYQHVGQQDITSQVDFTSLMRLGEQYGLATVGYTRQRQFLTNLGFSTFLNALQTQTLSAARLELSRMALMSLIEPQEYGDFKVLAQAKGNGPGIALMGFDSQASNGHT